MFTRNAIAYAGLQNRNQFLFVCVVRFVFFLILLIFLPPQQAIEAVPPSWVFCASMSERSLRVLAQHDGGPVLMGIPVFFTGTQL